PRTQTPPAPPEAARLFDECTLGASCGCLAGDPPSPGGGEEVAPSPGTRPDRAGELRLRRGVRRVATDQAADGGACTRRRALRRPRAPRSGHGPQLDLAEI